MSKHMVGVKENQSFKNLDTKLEIWWSRMSWVYAQWYLSIWKDKDLWKKKTKNWVQINLKIIGHLGYKDLVKLGTLVYIMHMNFTCFFFFLWESTLHCFTALYYINFNIKMFRNYFRSKNSYKVKHEMMLLWIIMNRQRIRITEIRLEPKIAH